MASHKDMHHPAFERHLAAEDAAMAVRLHLDEKSERIIEQVALGRFVWHFSGSFELTPGAKYWYGDQQFRLLKDTFDIPDYFTNVLTDVEKLPKNFSFSEAQGYGIALRLEKAMHHQYARYFTDKGTGDTDFTAFGKPLYAKQEPMNFQLLVDDTIETFMRFL